MDRGRRLVGADQSAAAALAGGGAGAAAGADRLCLQGILHMLHNDITWQLLPVELGFGSDRPAGGAWAAGSKPGSSTSGTASCSPNSTRPANSTGPARAWTAPTSARKEGVDTGPSPVDRWKTGSKHDLICDGRGTPFKVITTAANVNDVTQTLTLVDGIPPVAGRPGRPRRRPDSLLGDKGYDSNPTKSCANTRSCWSSPARAPPTSRAWANSATSSGGPSCSSTSSSASPSAGNAEPNLTTPSSHWPPA